MQPVNGNTCCNVWKPREGFFKITEYINKGCYKAFQCQRKIFMIYSELCLPVYIKPVAPSL